MKPIKIIQKLNEAVEEEKDYTVVIGFLGGYDGADCDGSKEYVVSATSRADAVRQVLDDDNDPLVAYDLDVSDIKKDESGDWEVRVSFGEGDYNPGYHTYIFDGSLDEVSVKEAALDEARYEGDLYVESVDGTEFDYEMGECDKPKKLKESDEELYVYSDANSYEKEEAEGNMYNFQQEAPELTFKLRLDSYDNMWFIDFIGKYDDIVKYLVKLGWYSEEFIRSHDLIEPYRR